MQENATYIAVNNTLAKQILSGDMKDIYERDLEILSVSGVVQDVTARKLTGEEAQGWVLFVKIKEKEEEILIITARNTPRRWKKIDTIEAFIRKTCPKVGYFKVEL
jgi:hypothetical protein